MTALYNEIDPFAAQWTRNLVAAGHIANGVVDETSIARLQAADVAGPGQRHFFAGIGGWSHALRLAGVPDDASVWTGSCPCQPFSAAGRGDGLADSRHLWPVWFRLISECRPPVVFGEQVASAAGLVWLDAVFADLEGAGYSCAAADLSAAGLGSPHIRQRLYFVAYADREQGRLLASRVMADRNLTGLEVVGEQQARDQLTTTERGREASGMAIHRATAGFWSPCEWVACSDGRTRPVEPGTFPLAHGVSARVGKLRTYGNAIVPQVAAAFITAALDAALD